MKSKIILLLLVNCLLFISCKKKDKLNINMDEIKKEVWKAELQYWNYLKTRNISEYKQMLSEDFSDWPASTSEPIVSIDNMIDFVSNTLNNFSSIDFKLEHKFTKIIGGNKVIVYFNCKVIGTITDEDMTVNLNNRMLHIWHKKKSVFKLVGGLQTEL